MSDELIVCIGILILSVIVAVIVIVYICALVAITRAEEYQKDERDIIRDPVDKLRRIPEGIHPGRQSEGCSEGSIREDSGGDRNIKH